MERINYIEFAAKDLATTKRFFQVVFGWEFEDFGDAYTAFSANESGLDGGFYQADMQSDASTGAALVVFYSDDLEATKKKVGAAGGVISTEIFPFPGGKRFHFKEPCGNEFAVWSDKN